MSCFKVLKAVALALITFLSISLRAEPLDEKWLYAAAFKVDGGSRCIYLSAIEQFKECAAGAFSSEMQSNESLDELMALMRQTNARGIKPCDKKVLSDASLDEAKSGEIYGCLELDFSESSVRVEDYYKNYGLLVVKLVQIKDGTLRITQVKPTQKRIALICESFSWNDIEDLARPYLSEDLQVALTMQALSSEYRVSDAASQAYSDNMPEGLKKFLQALIDAGC